MESREIAIRVHTPSPHLYLLSLSLSKKNWVFFWEICLVINNVFQYSSLDILHQYSIVMIFHYFLIIILLLYSRLYFTKKGWDFNNIYFYIICLLVLLLFFFFKQRKWNSLILLKRKEDKLTAFKKNESLKTSISKYHIKSI